MQGTPGQTKRPDAIETTFRDRSRRLIKSMPRKKRGRGRTALGLNLNAFPTVRTTCYFVAVAIGKKTGPATRDKRAPSKPKVLTSMGTTVNGQGESSRLR